tara:strand:- start:593 stop:904 length:312 start_codon:yes stop_codon:yes gene_type:complete
MKMLFSVLSTPINKLRLTMVVSYLFAFLFFVMAVVDLGFGLSPAVVTISIDSSFIQLRDYGIGYYVYYFLGYAIFWKLMGWAVVRIDAVEGEQKSLSKIIILD